MVDREKGGRRREEGGERKAERGKAERGKAERVLWRLEIVQMLAAKG